LTPPSSSLIVATLAATAAVRFVTNATELSGAAVTAAPDAKATWAPQPVNVLGVLPVQVTETPAMVRGTGGR
jgi:hypothetical protein